MPCVHTASKHTGLNEGLAFSGRVRFTSAAFSLSGLASAAAASLHVPVSGTSSDFDIWTVLLLSRVATCALLGLVMLTERAQKGVTT